MIFLALLAALILAALVYEKHKDGLREGVWVLREEAWVRERRELLTRIQHPRLVIPDADPVETGQPEVITPEVDDIDLVGTIVSNDGD